MLGNLKKIVKRLLYIGIDAFSYIFFKSDNTIYLDVDLKGGLCNKLFCLMSACEIAKDNNYILLEPYFGWKTKILFSTLYDMEYFNNCLKHYNNDKNIMISRKSIRFNSRKKKNIRANTIDLYKHTVKRLDELRLNQEIPLDSIDVLLMKALRLNKKYLSIVDNYSKIKCFTALQVRTETDWVNYSKKKKVGENEILLVNLEDLVKMMLEFDSYDYLFFTSGENHEKIESAFNSIYHRVKYFYDDLLEYEINGAINFEICCKSNKFVGLSRSTYSNLITLRRALNGQNQSYIYNFKDKILERVDKGLQPEASKSVNLATKLT